MAITIQIGRVKRDKVTKFKWYPYPQVLPPKEDYYITMGKTNYRNNAYNDGWWVRPEIKCYYPYSDTWEGDDGTNPVLYWAYKPEHPRIR